MGRGRPKPAPGSYFGILQSMKQELRPLRLTLAGSQDRRVRTNGVNSHTRMLEESLPLAGVRIVQEVFPSESGSARRRLLAGRVAGRVLDRDRDARVLRDLVSRHSILVREARAARSSIVGCNVVHAQDYLAASALAQALGRDLPPMVLAYHVNGTPDAELRARFDLPEGAASVRWVLTHMTQARNASRALVPVSPWAAEELARSVAGLDGGPAAVHVIPNGIVLPSLEGSIPMRDRPLRLVSLGQLIPRKGYDVLLDALHLWATDAQRPGPLPPVQIAGSGPLQATLQATAERLGVPVRFLGSIDEVGPFLEEARLFVLPSREDNLPMALLEAMAHGLPVVATRVGGIPDAVGEGPDAAGSLVAPGDAASLARALYPYVQDADLCEQVGKRARRRMEQGYSAVHMAQAYAGLYRTVAGGDVI